MDLAPNGNSRLTASRVVPVFFDGVVFSLIDLELCAPKVFQIVFSGRIVRCALSRDPGLADQMQSVFEPSGRRRRTSFRPNSRWNVVAVNGDVHLSTYVADEPFSVELGRDAVGKAEREHVDVGKRCISGRDRTRFACRRGRLMHDELARHFLVWHLIERLVCRDDE